MPAFTTRPGLADVSRPRRRRATLGFGLLLALLVTLAGGAVLYSKAWHPSESAYPLQGIDISHHQGAIDWAALPAQGVDFAYLKATEGGDFTDPDFTANWDAAGRAGISRGAYHFFTLCRPGAEQADNFIASVPVMPGALPPAIDLEFMGNCTTRPAIADVKGELRAFLARVAAHYGQPAVLYLTEEFDDAYHVSAAIDRPLWLRSLVLEPRFGARRWTIWQASNFRMLDGIEGRVDWNVMRGVSG